MLAAASNNSMTSRRRMAKSVARDSENQSGVQRVGARHRSVEKGTEKNIVSRRKGMAAKNNRNIGIGVS